VQQLHLAAEIEERDMSRRRGDGERLSLVVCPEREHRDFSCALAFEANLAEHLAQSDVEEDAGAACEADAENVDGGRL
jgi:hypothetical protein